ncbi:MAG: hypothetical protein IT294_09990 [Deltaproteobacteria bacterium]|nr:hypothetical protein [Deltaproteobacteria bacterium]
MTSQSRSPDANDDGVRIVRAAGARRLPWLIAAALAIPVLVTVVVVAVIRASAPVPTTPPASAVAVAVADAVPPALPAEPSAPVAAATPGVERVVPRRVAAASDDRRAERGGAATPAPEASPREIDAGDAIRALREEGIHTGIAAFGLPGSDPPKSGIIVPEDFPLPEGYVRHHQTTDDGEALPPILMFHPDYEFLDGRGRVVKVPEDRVVPRDMAPPGLDPDRVLHPPERKVGEPVH